MKRNYLYLLLIAGILILAFTACTPPPPEENPGDNGRTAVDNGNDAGTDTGGDTSTDVVTDNGDETPVDTGEGMEDGEGEDEGMETGEEVENGEETEVDEGETMTEISEVPENIFGEYETWPPDSITQEEVDLLNQILVVFETTKGIVKVRLFPENAPLHDANLVKLVQEGFYDGLTFHRVMSNFMSQGGDPDGTGGGGPGYTIPAEIGLPHVAGSMAAARTGDQINPERRSSGSQFYWVHTDQSCRGLNGQYTVYGQIVEGNDVNLSLSINYTNAGPTSGAETDSIIRAWVEMKE